MDRSERQTACSHAQPRLLRWSSGRSHRRAWRWPLGVDNGLGDRPPGVHRDLVYRLGV